MYILIITFIIESQFNTNPIIKNIDFSSLVTCQNAAETFKKHNMNIEGAKILTDCVKK